MTEDQDAKEAHSESGSRTFVNKSKDKKLKTQRPLTKIILRRLPPTMSEESFLDQVSPIPEHDHFYFAKPDSSLGNNLYSRAYINFVNVDDIYLFRDKFDGYVFVDERGVEYVGIVEYAPFQRIPKKKKKKDPKTATIESDPIFQDFIENLNKDQETENQPKLEYSYPVNDSNDKKMQTTPLLEYLAARKPDKRGRDERRRRENDKRKMRIERKTKDGPIKDSFAPVLEKKALLDYIMQMAKKRNTVPASVLPNSYNLDVFNRREQRSGDVSEDENVNENCEHNQNHNVWFCEQRAYKHKMKGPAVKSDLKTSPGSDEFISTDSDWDAHFPALIVRTHNTFTLTSGKLCDEKQVEASQQSGGDTCSKEEDSGENEVKKIKSRDWEKDKNESKDDYDRDGSVYESKTYRERKTTSNYVADKKKKLDNDKGNNYDDEDDSDRGSKKEKRDKNKESPREQKSKKYSDTRKERFKCDVGKSDKQAAISKLMSSDSKSKSLNHDDIKPFTQLPQVKTDDLSKIIDSMDKKMKMEESRRDSSEEIEKAIPKIRRSSMESADSPIKEEFKLKRQKSLNTDDRGKSTDREDSEEKEKGDNVDRRTERRIRNKDRPSLVIYQPGMGRFSKQRLAKEKDGQLPTAKNVNESEKKDT